MFKKIVIITIIISVAIAGYWFYQSVIENSTKALSQEIARDLVLKKWGGCATNECLNLTINILENENKSRYIQTIYDGLKDDSVKARRQTIPVYYENGKWKLGNESKVEYKCQLGRGHKNFSSELCL